MKTSKQIKNHTVILFWYVPSCSAMADYKKKSDLLNQAIDEAKRIQLVTSGNKTLLLNKIGLESKRFFGFETIKGELHKMFLNINEIKKITLL